VTALDRHANSETPRRGWVLYDGECGLCTRWIQKWQKPLTRRGFAIKDLQSASAEGLLTTPQENLLDDIRVLTVHGKIISGADAYLFLSRHIWWTWPFYFVFRLPGFRWLLERAYRWINQNRYRFSRSCPLPQQASQTALTSKKTEV
jgi:predicted DCC family thiol-disulfide oxidoreductase YuxK